MSQTLSEALYKTAVNVEYNLHREGAVFLDQDETENLIIALREWAAQARRLETAVPGLTPEPHRGGTSGSIVNLDLVRLRRKRQGAA